VVVAVQFGLVLVGVVEVAFVVQVDVDAEPAAGAGAAAAMQSEQVLDVASGKVTLQLGQGHEFAAVAPVARGQGERLVGSVARVVLAFAFAQRRVLAPTVEPVGQVVHRPFRQHCGLRSPLGLDHLEPRHRFNIPGFWRCATRCRFCAIAHLERHFRRF